MRPLLLVGSALCLLLACDKGDDAMLPCGELSCAGGEVCVEDRVDASCSELADGEACPQGTTEGQCGGVGYACCCAPPPPSTYRCESADACDGSPACACLPMLCPDDKECGQKDEGAPQFACESPAVP